MSRDRIQETVRVLSELTPGFQEAPVFRELARINALPIVELVPLRRTAAGSDEVLLIRRDADDHFWPGQWHTPGTVILADDPAGDDPEYAWEGPMKRLLEGELQGAELASEPQFVAPRFAKGKRGTSVALLFWAELERSPVGEYFPVAALPKDLIAEQHGIIAGGVRAFRECRDS